MKNRKLKVDITKGTILLLLAVVLVGCEKADLSEYIDNGDKEDGYKTTFTFNTLSITNFDDNGTRATKPLSEIATTLNFAVFQNGDKVITANQKSTDKDFGTISVNLPAGDYQIAVVAHNASGNATMTSAEKIAFASNKVTDTFSTFRDISVSGSKEYDLSMLRSVSMFRLRLDQEIPAEVTKLKFYYTGGSSTLDATTGFGCVNSRQTEYRDVTNHSNGQVFEVYTFPHDTEGTLNMTITALDDKDNVYAEKTLANVEIKMRHITTYHGSLFLDGNDNKSNTLTFTANDEWLGESETAF